MSEITSHITVDMGAIINAIADAVEIEVVNNEKLTHEELFDFSKGFTESVINAVVIELQGLAEDEKKKNKLIKLMARISKKNELDKHLSDDAKKNDGELAELLNRVMDGELAELLKKVMDGAKPTSDTTH